MLNYTNEINRCLLAIQNEVQQLLELVTDTIEKERQIFLIGNGGSLATCSHIVNDLRKNYTRVFVPDSLPLLTATANDLSWKEVFREQLMGLIDKGDLLIGLSVSGQSQNVILAIQHAEVVAAKTVFLTGQHGSPISYKTFHIAVPSTSFGIVESCHMIILHYIADRIQNA